MKSASGSFGSGVALPSWMSCRSTSGITSSSPAVRSGTSTGTVAAEPLPVLGSSMATLSVYLPGRSVMPYEARQRAVLRELAA